MNSRYARSKLYFSIILLLFFVIGIGYAAIGSNLSVTNNIKITGYKSKKLYDYMKVNSYADNTSSPNVNSSSGISFSAVGSTTNGQGIYMMASTSGNEYPIYYYRGPVTDNNVIFANKCWKILRTTNTGGIKILYSGVPFNGSCNNEGTALEIGKSAFNTYTNPSIADVGYMYGTRYEVSQTSSMGSTKYKYGNDVTYSNGTYTLKNVSSSTSSYTLSYSSLRKGYHYSCLSTSTSCSTVYYIYSFALTSVHKATLTGGLLLSNYLGAATSSSTNTTNSTIKSFIDNWYSSNLSSYSSYLEDTSFCNDRSIYAYNGWDKDSSSTSDMYFNGYNRNFLTYSPSITCSNSGDNFSTSTSNGNGKLTYPIGLITADEVLLGSGGSSGYLYSSSGYWTMTPSYFGDTSTGSHNYVLNLGVLESLSKVSAEYGVRPVVSLKQGIEYSSGDGSPSNPYIIG